MIWAALIIGQHHGQMPGGDPTLDCEISVIMPIGYWPGRESHTIFRMSEQELWENRGPYTKHVNLTWLPRALYDVAEVRQINIYLPGHVWKLILHVSGQVRQRHYYHVIALDKHSLIEHGLKCGSTVQWMDSNELTVVNMIARNNREQCAHVCGSTGMANGLSSWETHCQNICGPLGTYGSLISISEVNQLINK